MLISFLIWFLSYFRFWYETDKEDMILQFQSFETGSNPILFDKVGNPQAYFGT